MKKKTKIHKKIMNEQKTFVKVKVKVKKENIIRKSSKPEQIKCSKEESGMLEKVIRAKRRHSRSATYWKGLGSGSTVMNFDPIFFV
jgi:hypothetical protein